jgi:hypothetical protein
MSPSWRLEFCGGSQTVGKFVNTILVGKLFHGVVITIIITVDADVSIVKYCLRESRFNFLLTFQKTKSVQ